MGYWGTLIAVRGDPTMAALQDLDASVCSHEGAVRGDGWRVYDVADNILGQGLEPLLNLVTDSSNPVIAAYIADSDYGQVIAATRPVTGGESGLTGTPRTRSSATTM